MRSKKINSGTSDSIVYTYDYNGKLNNVEDNINGVEYSKNSFVTLSQGNSNTNIRQVLNITTNDIKDGSVTLNEQSIGCLLEDNKNAQLTCITTYSKNNIVKTITEQINQDDLKRINSEYINNFSRTFEYKTNGSYTTPFASKETFKKENVILGEASYGYTNGLITSITRDGYTITYQYDKLNRIVSEYNPKLGIDRTFTYDEKGNLLITGKNMTYSGQKLTKFNGQTLTYDSYNRLSKYGNINITFEKDRLKVYNNINFSYDGEGKRIQKSSSSKTHKYYYDGNRLFKESITENNTTKNIYYIRGAKGVIGFIYDDAQYYYNRNILGDVVSILNSDEVIVASYEYDAWGNHNVYDTNGALDTSASSIGNINPIRYRGYYYDKETQLYWVSSRYYSPELCRWISPDSIEYLDPESINGLNLYAYCGNDPVNYSDGSGHMPEWLSATLKITAGAAIIAGCVAGSILTGGTLSVILAGAAIGASAGGISAGISTAVSGGDINDFANAFLMGTATGAISGAAAASPLKVGYQIGINAILGAVNYVGNQGLSGNKITLGGLIINAGIGALCGWIGQNGWMCDQGALTFIAFSGKNALKYVGCMVGAETLIRMTLPAFVLGGLGGGIYGRISSYFNPNGDFIGI